MLTIFRHFAMRRPAPFLPQLHPRPHILPPHLTHLPPAPLFTLHKPTSNLVFAVSSFSFSISVRCRPAPYPLRHSLRASAAPNACSLAFFREVLSAPFRSDIPETQLGRGHAMRRTGEERTQQGDESELMEDMGASEARGRRYSYIGGT